MMIKRLRNLAPRRAARDPSPADVHAVHAGAVALDDVTSGPTPVLRPAAIFHQTLFDPDEATPVWARPRAASAPLAASPSAPAVKGPATAPVAPTDEPTPAKRTRRPKAKDSSGAAPTRSKKAAKPDRRTTAD